MDLALLTLNTLVCAGVFFTGFCRIHKMDRMTVEGVRLSVVALTVASVGAMLAPFIREWDTRLDLPEVLFRLAVLVLQLTSARLWYGGQPDALRRRSDFE